MKIVRLFIVSALSITLLFACSEKKSDTFTPRTAKKTVTAATGGTVSTTDGSASVEIPAGALAQDTEITITEKKKDDYPEEEKLASSVWHFGPDGLTFSKPITMSIKLDRNKVEDEVGVIAVHREGAWHSKGYAGGEYAAGDPI
ncbi:MAG TPA: hypothetical protein PKH10_01050, partial [bacterium]|nr:hypothetical protein [bacterium]